eukprot:scaffold8977_cov128-Isochrysis_galbana.AAC.5
MKMGVLPGSGKVEGRRWFNSRKSQLGRGVRLLGFWALGRHAVRCTIYMPPLRIICAAPPSRQ